MNILLGGIIGTVCHAGGFHHALGSDDGWGVLIFILHINDLPDSGLNQCFRALVARKEGGINAGTL